VTFDIVAGLVAVGFVIGVVRSFRNQRTMDPLRAEAQDRSVLLRSRVAVKYRYPDAPLWSGRPRFWSTKTLALMEVVVYPGIVAVSGRAGVGRMLGSEWWLRSGEATMTWATIIGKRWIAICGPSARGTVEIAVRADDEERLRDALASSGVRPR